MIWLADSNSSYASGAYRVIFAVRYWTSWYFGLQSQKLGDSESAKAEMQRCEEHAKTVPA